MMLAVFAAMTLALILGWAGRDQAALAAIAAAVILAVWLFLFEVYSPEYGFRMPWISTEAPYTTPQTGVLT
jgi:hypothetical protein